MTARLRSTARAAAIAAVIGGAALAGTGLAGADFLSAQDQRFLSILDSKGIAYTSAADVIPVGLDICSDLNRGIPGDTEYYVLIGTYPELGADGASGLMYAAVLSYCQQHLQSLPL